MTRAAKKAKPETEPAPAEVTTYLPNLAAGDPVSVKRSWRDDDQGKTWANALVIAVMGDKVQVREQDDDMALFGAPQVVDRTAGALKAR